MPRAEARERHVHETLKRLRGEFPEPVCALVHDGPYQLLIATMLSAQCTDARVNIVTPELFRQAPTPQAMVALGEAKIKHLIRSINFFNNKAKNIFNASKAILAEHDGRVPPAMDALTALPGVGRKTANVVLGTGFQIPGVVVDTHVTRLANRFGWAKGSDAVKLEHQLEKIVPREDWIDLSHLLILHGRATCKALRPLCDACVVADLCPSRQPTGERARRASSPRIAKSAARNTARPAKKRRRTMALAGLLLGFLSMNPARAAANFASYYWTQVNAGNWPMAAFPTRIDDTAPCRALPKLPEDWAKIYAAKDLKNATWWACPLSADLVPPSGQPGSPLTNASIIEARRGKETLAAFRPIATTSGCNSGCSAVVFHLKFNSDHHLTAILESPKEPLRKLNHEPWSAAEKARILEVAQKIPDGFRWIDAPSGVADESTHPPQTWTALKPWLVEGAAYTSFRILEAATTTERYFRSTAVTRRSDDANRKAYFASALRATPDEAERVVAKLGVDAETNTEAKHLYGIAVAWWTTLDGKEASPLGKVRDGAELTFTRVNQPGLECRFIELLTDTDRGRDLLRAPGPLLKAHACGPERRPWLKMLAGGNASDVDVDRLLGELAQRPERLAAIARRFVELKETTKASKIVAALRTRYPHQDAFLRLATNEADLKAADDTWRTVLARQVSPERRALPAWPKGAPPRERILVFFAAWCPHCRALIESLKADLPASSPLWKNLRFVEIFVEGPGPAGGELFKAAGLPTTQLSWLDDGAKSREFLDQLNLFGVPRVLVLDPKGRVAVFNGPADAGAGQSLAREWQILLEESGR